MDPWVHAGPPIPNETIDINHGIDGEVQIRPENKLLGELCEKQRMENIELREHLAHSVKPRVGTISW